MMSRGLGDVYKRQEALSGTSGKDRLAYIEALEGLGISAFLAAKREIPCLPAVRLPLPKRGGDASAKAKAGGSRRKAGERSKEYAHEQAEAGEGSKEYVHGTCT